MSHSVFTYGTLQIPVIITAVTGTRPKYEEAILPQYACYRMKHRIYPGIIPCNNSCVSGRLYHDINETTLKYLDAFEDILYERQQLNVSTRTTCLMAEVYIVATKYRDLLLYEPWDIEQFKTKHLAHYLESCRKFYKSVSNKDII
jgi:gamma-glutamylcyclotransferase (GGCT)/AIG2-like uncharacterized protein YtfP